MSSLHKKKSKYWQNNIDADLDIAVSDNDIIEQLLVKTDFDTFNLPEIITKPDLLANDEHLVDINTTDNFHYATLPLETQTTDDPIPVNIETTDSIGHTKPSFPSNTASEPPSHHHQHKASVVTVLEPKETINSVNLLSNIVKNNTNEEIITASDVIIPNDALISQPTPKQTPPVVQPSPQPQAEGKRIQTAVTITSTIHDSRQDADWAVFKTEQEQLLELQKKRITELEKNLYKAMLFSHIALILAGIALITVVSGLV